VLLLVPAGEEAVLEVELLVHEARVDPARAELPVLEELDLPDDREFLAEVRSATGVTVFAGMIGVTLFGLFLTPVFYVGLRKLSGRELIQHGEASLLHG
jgi:hypothetical protein